MGATERAALDRLVQDFGAQVKVQYDAQRTRLHAKAWLFRRNTGFDTAYVGSSNLSRAAMLDGVEWNVRLSAVSTPALLQKFRATFDSYWNDATFETYDPAGIAIGWTMLWPRRPASESTTASRSPSPVSRCGPTPTSRRCSTSSTSSACPRPASQPARRCDRHRARPWWQPSTTGVWLPAPRRSLDCCSSRTAARSCSSRCAPTAKS